MNWSHKLFFDSVNKLGGGIKKHLFQENRINDIVYYQGVPKQKIKSEWRLNLDKHKHAESILQSKENVIKIENIVEAEKDKIIY